MTRRDAVALAFAVPTFGAESKTRSSAPIRFERLPNGGIQPQVATDPQGTLHVAYYSGDALHGDVFYARSTNSGGVFSTALRVNSPGSALAAGTIRGAQLALGKRGKVHVAWNGSSEASLKGPVNPDSGKPGAPMLYSRLNDEGSAFEAERNLMHRSFGLDGGGSIAADSAGNVYVVWHGIGTDVKSGAGPEGEARRAVWIAKSADNGRTFKEEEKAWHEPTGACACCGLKAFARRDGSVDSFIVPQRTQCTETSTSLPQRIAERAFAAGFSTNGR